MQSADSPLERTPQHWYERELSIDELARTVAVINEALRSTRAVQRAELAF